MRLRSLLPVLLLSLIPALAPARDVTVYIGTFTRFNGQDTGSKGIYLGHFDPETGRLGSFQLAFAGDNPSFLAAAPNPRFLYATSEVAETDGKPAGGVYAFAVDPAGGALTLLNRASSGGPGPTHIAVDPTGRTVAVSNYDNGTIAALPVLADGRLGEPATFLKHEGMSIDPKRQTHGYAHSVNFSPDGRFLFSDDLGIDKLYVYRVDAAHALLTPNDPAFVAIKPGSGPRHLALHPDGRHAYLISEMGSTITVFDFDAARGTFATVQTVSTLPPGFTGVSTGAEIAVHPSGRFVYASNRGDDSVALFSVDAGSGRLAFVEAVSTQGNTPRHFAIDPSGRWLIAANQNSGSLVVFRIDPASGRLSPAGVTVQLPAPVCVLFTK
jgi:6-phosphogluconolactonase